MGLFRLRSARIAITLLGTATFTLAGVHTAHAAPAVYTALGDSYSSGVGTRTYYPDSGSCYRSASAYPVLAAARLGATLTFAACSGARVADVLANQLGSLSPSTTLVTVSAGGNDAGFANVITSCARPWPWTCWGDINNANAVIRDTLPGRLDGLYRAIRDRAPNATVVVIGYPRIFNGEECNLGARISPGEQAELNRTADLLATAIGARAAAAGFAFVDARTPFTRHAVCDDTEWINGLSYPILESYHPNTNGHAAGYAPLLLAQLGVASTAV
ncbi:SGNH/GDSL hydrolase family protein [Actinophytocola sp.]|uniref:SGNH/GDSL hydrolase family protein n=1 Tax=Actinophytocola sp. TaxID=1872138 RepID=UPI002D809DF7|nr:SGNH/GDSL hydrolase family protein [Actinophytocola sp.]HET9139024.1 SGNH/GDSL hydrolase family protein [Actinophytocola sp.]